MQNGKILFARFLRIIILIFGIIAFQAIHAKPLSAIEKEISAYISKQQPQQLSLLEELVNVNSGTTNLSGVHQVGEMLRPQFEQFGFKTRWVEEPADMNRAGTLVAEHIGTQGKKLLLIGHLDTVFPKESTFQRFEQLGENARGPGVVDDKGGIVVILYALKALDAVHALDNMTIRIILTGDEEDSGKSTSISRKPLFAAARQSDIALDFEWAINLETATIARRGVANWILQTQGKEDHSSKIFQPSTGYGAIFELSRILNTMRAELAAEKYLSFNPGLVLGGTTISYDNHGAQGTAGGKGNVVAKAAIAKGDLRFLTAAQQVKAERKISSIISQHLPATTATITFQNGIPSMPPAPAHAELLKKYSEISIGLGQGPVKPLNPGLRGAADISHIGSMVSANLAGLGPVGTGAHSAEERLDIRSLPVQTQRAAILVYRLTR